MSREKAIEFGKKWLQINEYWKGNSTYSFFQIAIKALEQEPRWIPISEKWPEDCQEVLVTTDEGDLAIDVFHADSGGCYFEDRDIEYVKAWMPLPKPYNVESEAE